MAIGITGKHVKRRQQVLIIFIGFIMAGTVFGSDGLQAPLRKDGQQWTVKTQYAGVGTTDRWSAPAEWLYRAVKNADGTNIVTATPGGGDAGSAATLVYRESDGALIRLEARRTAGGREIATAIDIAGGAPVETMIIPCPADSPAFPLVPGTERSYSYSFPLPSGIKIQKTVVQAVAWRRALPEGTPIEAEGPFYEVVCRDTGGVMLFRQFWQAGRPWPVYGENRSMRYWTATEQ